MGKISMVSRRFQGGWQNVSAGLIDKAKGCVRGFNRLQKKILKVFKDCRRIFFLEIKEIINSLFRALSR